MQSSVDLLSSVKGMFRILDLISEQGSGGLGMNLWNFSVYVGQQTIL